MDMPGIRELFIGGCLMWPLITPLLIDGLGRPTGAALTVSLRPDLQIYLEICLDHNLDRTLRA